MNRQMGTAESVDVYTQDIIERCMALNVSASEKFSYFIRG
jgi:hypothetical protein